MLSEGSMGERVLPVIHQWIRCPAMRMCTNPSAQARLFPDRPGARLPGRRYPSQPGFGLADFDTDLLPLQSHHTHLAAFENADQRLLIGVWINCVYAQKNGRWIHRIHLPFLKR
ncbi:MAG: hypothetical protein CBC13_00520 [Planctomycetia bacterium TMED53]|nr:MAG: hypothetical protein CBC13_00520 [Planctomycetia bacterium TMED53]